MRGVIVIRGSVFRQKKVYTNRIQICSQIGEIYEQNSDMKLLSEIAFERKKRG